MIDAGIVGANDNVNETISDDMFDGIIDILDFPMEDIDAGGEAEELQGESSPLNDFSALPCPFSGNSCNETSNLRKSAGTQIEPMIVIDTCSGNISLHGDSSDDKESLKLQNSTTSEAGKSASEPFSQTTETSEGCSNSTKGKQKKKRRKKLSPLSGPMGVKKQWLRQPSTIGRCMHCNVTRTPQWRAGPYGPKTLCNACGVCYRRGSLFPEYRPASSPTFVASLHTNFRRKIVDMRKKAGQEEHAVVGATSLHSNSHGRVTKASHRGSQVGATFLTISDSKPGLKVTEVIMKASAGVGPISVASLPPPQRKVNEMRSDGVQEEKLATSLHSNCHSKVTKASYKGCQVGATFLTNSDSKPARKVTEVTKASVGVSPISVASLPPPQRKVNEMRSDGVKEEKLTTSLHSNSHSKVTKASYKRSQVGATFLTTSDSKSARKVIEVITKASMGVIPISVASLPLPQSKVNEMRSNGVQKEKLAAAMTTTFVASLHSNSHKKCSFQRPVTVRKCIHCEATRTPLWRRGPWGPKSLCNACGLRFRSGRLFPEYHPAASPTFVASFHSNSHKKVLEMRNKAITSQQLSSAAPDGNAPQPLTTQSIKKE